MTIHQVPVEDMEVLLKEKEKYMTNLDALAEIRVTVMVIEKEDQEIVGNMNLIVEEIEEEILIEETEEGALRTCIWRACMCKFVLFHHHFCIIMFQKLSQFYLHHYYYFPLVYYSVVCVNSDATFVCTI